MTTSPLPDGASETIVPETVIEPPGVRVWLPMMKSDDGFAVYVAPPIVRRAGPVVAAIPPDPVEATARDCVEEPPITA